MARILIVEDAPEMRQMLEATVARAGHDVATAADGETAMALAETTRFDLVIADLVLPGMGGLQVLRDLRQQIPRPKVIAISGGDRLSAAGYLEIAALFGAIATLEKPFTPQALIGAIDGALGSGAG